MYGFAYFFSPPLLERSLALTFSFGEKVSKKNFNFVKSIFEEHRFDGSPYLRNHKFAVPLTLGPSFSVRPENEAKEGSQEHLRFS